ncbi:hypothetical protein [Vreelandella aquamarina]|uniref:hypothetical protein n=1 Tax=Vreelandella aquamarina TaxID=77097 RepID=UPI0038514C66
MQFPPWLLSFVFGTALIASSGSVLAETEAETDSGQHQALDDAALEEKYGIKAGSVQRDEQPSNVAATDEASAEEGADNGGEDTEGGTGGTGSAEDAIENGEDEQSNDDNE